MSSNSSLVCCSSLCCWNTLLNLYFLHSQITPLSFPHPLHLLLPLLCMEITCLTDECVLVCLIEQQKQKTNVIIISECLFFVLSAVFQFAYSHKNHFSAYFHHWLSLLSGFVIIWTFVICLSNLEILLWLSYHYLSLCADCLDVISFDECVWE